MIKETWKGTDTEGRSERDHRNNIVVASQTIRELCSPEGCVYAGTGDGPWDYEIPVCKKLTPREVRVAFEARAGCTEAVVNGTRGKMGMRKFTPAANG